MQFFLCFFYGQKTSSETVERYLPRISEPYHIITNSTGLKEHFVKKGKIINMLDELVPDEGIIGKEIYRSTKKVHEEYKKILSKIKFENYTTFNGFDYALLRQLTFLFKVARVLELKKNTIFIFEGYHFIYPAFFRIALDRGYETNSKIGFIQSKKLDFIELFQNTKKTNARFTFLRTLNFLKSSMGKDFSIKNLNIFLNFAFDSISFMTKKTLGRFSGVKNLSSEKILDNLEKKILKTKEKFALKCAFFITASREDLYIKPWYPVFTKFEENKIPFLIFTGDFPTSIVLSKEKKKHINVSEEINLLLEFYKNTNLGLEIQKNIINFSKQNKSLIAFEQLVEYLSHSIFRTIATLTICEYLAKRMSLKSIVVAADGEMLENCAVEIGKRHNITSFSMIPTVINELPIFTDWFHAERIFVYGIHGLEVLGNLGYEKRRLISTGASKYDHFFSLEKKCCKLNLVKNYHISNYKRILTVGMSVWRENDEMWMTDLIKFCNKNHIFVIIKIHPKYETASHELSEEKIKKIENKCSGFNYLISYNLDLPELLCASDIIITDYSNVGIDAIIMNKPLITVNLMKENWENYPQRMDRFGASIYVEEYKKLEEFIIGILENQEMSQNLKDNRKKIIERYNFYNDGKASERIFNFLINN